MNIPNLNLDLPDLKNNSSLSVFKLIQSNCFFIQSLNKGYNKEDIDIGFYHIVGYNKEEDLYLLAKPVQEINEPRLSCFIISNEFYKENCKTLLSFTLNNN